MYSACATTSMRISRLGSPGGPARYVIDLSVSESLHQQLLGANTSQHGCALPSAL